MRATSSDGVDRARLRVLPLFAGCSDSTLDAALLRLPLVTADADEVLVAEGDPGDEAFIISSGRASVSQRGSLLATLRSGDLFGEVAMVAGGVRTATVRASTPMEMLRLDAETFADLTGTQTIAWNVLRALVQRTKERAVGRDVGAPTTADAPLGEWFSVAERVVVAPSAGTFRPNGSVTGTPPGEPVVAGHVLGFVDSLATPTEVRSPFAGVLMGMLALPGERVRAGQPVAWLRTF